MTATPGHAISVAMTDSDALYHRLFSHPLMIEHLVRDFVPEAMTLDLDFTGLQRVNDKFHSRRDHRRESDVIWRLPTRTGDDIYLYLLLEFQSGNDYWMAVRAQVYEGLLWQHVIAEKKLKTGDRLPPLLTLVLYNGDPRWTAPTDLSALIALPADSPLWSWQPHLRYYLMDIGRFPRDTLVRLDTLPALLFRLEQPTGVLEELGDLVDEVIVWFRGHPDYVELKRLFTELVHQAATSMGAPQPLPKDLMEMTPMLTTTGDAIKRHYFAEGEAKGEAKALIRLLEKRHGPLPDNLLAAISTADLATLDLWLDRVIDGQDLNAVFAPPN
jgi:hypothetical protein